MGRTKYEQGDGFLVIQDYKNTHHIPIKEISHLKSGHENHAIFVLKSGKEIPTKHWMNRARKMFREAIQKSNEKDMLKCKCHESESTEISSELKEKTTDLTQFTSSPVGYHQGCGERVYRDDAEPHNYSCWKCGELIVENEKDVIIKMEE